MSVTSLHETMMAMGATARASAQVLANASAASKKAALLAMAAAIRAQSASLLSANEEDVAAGVAKGLTGSFLDRLTLTPQRIEAMAQGIDDIAQLPDPVGRVLAAWTRPNGLKIERVATPLGVIGVIFESRPNVTADAGALCLAAGNAVILRGGSESFASSQAIHQALVVGLRAAGLPEGAIQFVPTRDREAVGLMLKGLNGTVDVIVPRGGKSLVARVQDEARVPVFSHLDGICHVYVHSAADLAMAKSILRNAKLRRTGVCGAAETLLIDRQCPPPYAAELFKVLLDEGCEVRCDAELKALDPRLTLANDADWSTEYLAPILSARLVDGVDAAMAHIARYGSHHTETIITQDEAVAALFLQQVDSAIVMHNASTQFADGGEFGMGAEIGIATGRLHARGPVGVEQLCSFKYRVHGTGQIRP